MHGVIEEVKLISYVFDYLFMKEGQGLTLLRTQGKMWVKQLQKIHISMILNHQQALNQRSREDQTLGLGAQSLQSYCHVISWPRLWTQARAEEQVFTPRSKGGAERDQLCN